MDLNFFLICFGVLACYALFRTTRKGWIKGLIVFLGVMCLIHAGFDMIFPRQEYQPQQIALSAPTLPQIQVSTPSLTGGQSYIQRKIAQLKDDRCLLAVFEESPLGPVAYAMELHDFLKNYSQTSGGSAVGNINQALNTTVGTVDPDSICGRFSQWVTSQTKTQLQAAMPHGD